MKTFQEISDHMTCHNECSDVCIQHAVCMLILLHMHLTLYNYIAIYVQRLVTL